MANLETGIAVAEAGEQVEYVLVRQLSSLFPANQVAARRGLHELLVRSPSKALDALYRVLVEQSAGLGEPFVISLLAADETRLSPLIHSTALDHASAARIVQRLAQVEPGLEAILLRAAMRERDTEILLRVLSILEEAGGCVRITQQLQMLSRQPDDRIRAKAAKMVVRVNRERDRLVQLFSDPDARVRANAAEGLLSITPKPAEIKALWQLATDEHHRPATTALAVLAIGGDRQAADKLIELVQSSNEPFRLAAAWAMGRVADPAFLPILQQLIREHPGSLKGMALRSCTLIRKSNARSEPRSEPSASLPEEIQLSAPG